MVLRYCLGMILSVSTLIIGSGAATPVSVVNFCIARPIGNARPGLAEASRHGKAALAAGGGRAKKRGRDWVPASRRLGTLESGTTAYFAADAVQIGLPSAPLKSRVHDVSICCTTELGSGT